MLLDKNNMFSVQQDLAKAAASYLSDKSIDLGPTGTIPSMFQAPGQTNLRNPGNGEPVGVLIQVVQTFTSGGAGTLKAELVMAADAALTSSLVVLEASDTIALATLVQGYKFAIAAKLPDDRVTSRYLGVRYTIGTATMTAGKVSAGIVVDKQTNV